MQIHAFVLKKVWIVIFFFIFYVAATPTVQKASFRWYQIAGNAVLIVNSQAKDPFSASLHIFGSHTQFTLYNRIATPTHGSLMGDGQRPAQLNSTQRPVVGFRIGTPDNFNELWHSLVPHLTHAHTLRHPDGFLTLTLSQPWCHRRTSCQTNWPLQII